MLSEDSEDDFCDTNFCKPSPNKRSALLPPAKERNELQLKREEFRNRVLKIEKECFSYIASSLKFKECEPDSDKTVPDSSEAVLFFPGRRIFFKPAEISRASLQPFLWLDRHSPFYKMTSEEFIFNISEFNLSNEGETERNQLIYFCLNFLVHETDPVINNLLVNFLSKQAIPYSMVTLKEWGVPSLPFLLPLISKSVSGYTPAETRELFRQVCLAALDPKCFSLTSELNTLISECLGVFAVQHKALEEVDWLISLDLKPEEGFRILEILPINGLFSDLKMYFAWKLLHAIKGLKSSHLEDQDLSWDNLLKFLKENESNIRNLTPKFYFIFIYILELILTRVSEGDYHSVEEMLNVINGFKLKLCQENRNKGNMSCYLSLAALNRLHLISYEHLKYKK